METNERLRDAITKAGFGFEELAEKMQVDPKTVSRWVTQGRAPYPKTRARVAAILGESQTYLWSDAFDDKQKAVVSESELIRTYRRRSEVENDTWAQLVENATERIYILAYAGLFLPEQQPKLAKTLCAKAEKGVDVRILLGDPEGERIKQRGIEEGIGDAMSAKIRNVLSFYESHIGHDCLKIRLHNTTLYNSIYRFDNEMLVNSHVFGVPAAHAPVMKFRQLPGGEVFDVYADSLERVWGSAVPAWGQIKEE